MAQQPVLKHSYTFDGGTASDVVNGADGIIHGDARIEKGVLITDKQGQYLELPAQKININSYSSLTLEVLFKAESRNGNHTMISYFGNIDGSIGTHYIFQSVINGGKSKSAISCMNSSTPWNSETALVSKMLTDGNLHHLVTTIDNKEMKFYIDGVLTGSTSLSDHPNNTIAHLGTTGAFLCKGGYSSDPTWLGSIDEFNIYEGILDADAIAQNAMEHLPNWELAKVKEFLNQPVSNLVVDASEELDQPITEKAIYFAELIPSENDKNNCVDECFVFSDGPLNDWKDASTIVVFSSYNGYINVWDDPHNGAQSDTKIEVSIGQVYQCWMELNVTDNTYSVYIKGGSDKKPVLIRKDASFRNKVRKLNRWSSIYNRDTQTDAFVTNAVSEVSKVGEYPVNYAKPESAPLKKSVLNQKVPKDAMVIQNPIHGFQIGALNLKKVVVSDDETALYFRSFHSLGNAINIPPDTYIQSVGGEKLYLKDTEGIDMQVWTYPSAKGYTDIKLIFPAIDTNTSAFEYGEENGGWHVYDIQLKSKDDLPKNWLAGSWFNTKTGDWEFSFLDSVVIYDNKIWQVANELPIKKKGVLNLVHENEDLVLNYQLKKDRLLIGETNLHMLSKDARYDNVENPSNPPMYEKPIFKLDTAVFSGYFYGYDTRAGFKTGLIYVDNILTGNQESHIIKIDESGYFSVKIPVCYPHLAYLRMNNTMGSVFLEPGKEVFVLANMKERSGTFVMGDNARLNTEISSKIDEGLYRNRFYRDVYDIILDMTPVEYKVYNLSKSYDDLKVLNTLYANGEISDRYYQMMKVEIPSYYNRNILHYHYTLESAYRKKNNIPNNQRSLPVSFKVPSEPGFYDFLDADYLNDEITLLSSSFENFMNAFIYSPVMRGANHSWYDLVKYVYDEGKYKEEDKALIEEFLENFTPDFIEQQSAFYSTVGRLSSQFFKDYAKELDSIKEQETEELAAYLLVKQVAELDTLSDVYRNYCEKAIEYYSNQSVIKGNRFIESRIKDVQTLIDDYKGYQVSASMYARNRKLKEELRIPEGLTSDIMAAQAVLPAVVEKYTPLSDDELKKSQRVINNGFISDYLEVANNATLAKIEANKNKGGYTYNEVPNVEADKIFDAIVSKYKGNVVYVDFWATWCGPCRNSIKNQTQMKEDMADKNIKFVYITSPSSPETTYKNMIPDIKGEHYRVSKDEWNYLCEKFNISGIPHYAIVDKDGKVVDPDATRNPGELIPKFEELMNKN